MLTHSSEPVSLFLRKVYFGFVQVFFFLFLLGVLFFGRAFSTLKFFEFSWFPLYATDFFLLLTFPLILMSLPQLTLLPRAFKWIFGGFLGFSCSYLIWGFFVEGNKFALRDVVISWYLLIVLLVFVLFSKREMLYSFLKILLIGNIVNILVGHYMILDNLWLGRTFNQFIHQGKIFNFTLYYGIVSAFLIAYAANAKRKFHQIALSVLLSINLYLIYISSVRSAWVAFLILIIFNFVIYRTHFLKFCAYFLVTFVILGSLLYRIDFIYAPQSKNKPFDDKMAGMKVFISENIKTITEEERESSPGAMMDQAEGKSSNRMNSASEPLSEKYPSGAALKDQRKAVTSVRNNAQKKVVVPADVRIACDNIKWRLSIWEQTLAFGWQKPAFGQGFGHYPHYQIWTTAGVGGCYIKNFKENSGIIPPHNSLLTVFYKMGLLGIILFMILNGFIFWKGLSSLRTYPAGFLKTFLIGSLGGLVYWHVMALFFDVIDSPPTNVFLWILLGLILVSVYRKDELVNEKK